jgi:hypothetical protein
MGGLRGSTYLPICAGSYQLCGLLDARRTTPTTAPTSMPITKPIPIAKLPPITAPTTMPIIMPIPMGNPITFMSFSSKTLLVPDVPCFANDLVLILRCDLSLLPTAIGSA